MNCGVRSSAQAQTRGLGTWSVNCPYCSAYRRSVASTLIAVGSEWVLGVLSGLLIMFRV